MKKSVSKLMALMLIIALVSSFAAFSASAATTYTPIGGSTTITKNLVVESNANIPDIEFTYTITRAERIAPTTTTIEILQSTVGATIGTASFNNADTVGATAGLPTDTAGSPTAGFKYARKDVAITFPDGSFTKPGVYRYIVVEGNGNEPGVTYDSNNTRYVDVFVVANDSNTLSVSSYVVRSAATNIGNDLQYVTDPNGKSGGYTNTVTQHDFTFTKAIGGNQGDKNKRFTFTLNITNAIPGTYPLVINDVTGNPSSITVGSDGTYTGTFDLTNGSSIKVHGLNDGSVCVVSEDAQDYTPSHVVDSGAPTGTNSSGTITMNSDHSVAFTNTRNGVIPTGVLLTVAPFAIGLLLFGAVGITMLARKKEEE